MRQATLSNLHRNLSQYTNSSSFSWVRESNLKLCDWYGVILAYLECENPRTPPKLEFSCKCHSFLILHQIARETRFHWDSQRAWICFENHTRVFNSARADKHLFMEVTKKCAMLFFSYQCLTRVCLYTITVSYAVFNVVLWPLLNRIKLKHARFKDNTLCLILHRKIFFGRKQ